MGSHNPPQDQHRVLIEWSPEAIADIAVMPAKDQVDAIVASMAVSLKACDATVYMAEGTSWLDAWPEGRFLIRFSFEPGRLTVLGAKILNPLDDLPLGGFIVRRDSCHRVIRFRGRKGDPACNLPGDEGFGLPGGARDVLDDGPCTASSWLSRARFTVGNSLPGAPATATCKPLVRGARDLVFDRFAPAAGEGPFTGARISPPRRFLGWVDRDTGLPADAGGSWPCAGIASAVAGTRSGARRVGVAGAVRYRADRGGDGNDRGMNGWHGADGRAMSELTGKDDLPATWRLAPLADGVNYDQVRPGDQPSP